MSANRRKRTPDWVGYCEAIDFSVDPRKEVIQVEFSRTARDQRVSVAQEQHAYQLTSIVARRRLVQTQEDIAQRIWRLNRGSNLVGFYIDRRGRLVGQSWIPKAGLQEREFQLYVRTMAAEADRLEFVLTGVDRE
jgi:hypothetical protein